MFYALVVTDGAFEEICGVTTDLNKANCWVSGQLGGIAPKRIIKSFTEEISESHKESRWEGPFKHVNQSR